MAPLASARAAAVPPTHETLAPVTARPSVTSPAPLARRGRSGARPTNNNKAGAAGALQTQEALSQQPSAAAAARTPSWAAPLAAGWLLLRLGRAAVARVVKQIPRRGLEAQTLGGASSGGGRDGGGGPGGPALLWLRAELRLADHPALAAACREAAGVLPVFVFDPRECGGKATGGGGGAATAAVGPRRAAAVLDALRELRAALRARGAELAVRRGRAEDVLPQLAGAIGARTVFCTAGATPADRRAEAAVLRALAAQGGAAAAALKAIEGGGRLHEPRDLRLSAPTSSSSAAAARPATTPPRLAEFCERAGRARVRAPLPAPKTIRGVRAGAVAAGELPTLRELGYEEDPARAQKAAVALPPRGGERVALQQMQEFIASLKQGAPGAARRAPAAAFAEKVAPWLAIGALSPRTVHRELRRAHGTAATAAPAGGRGCPANARPAPVDGPRWVMQALLRRDFYTSIGSSQPAAKPAQAQQPTTVATPFSAPVPGLAMA